MLLPESRWRCGISATLGALYSCVNFFFILPAVIHLAVAVLMVAIILPRKSIRFVAIGWISFLMCEFFIGGCIGALRELASFIPKSGFVLASLIITTCVLCSYAYSLVQAIMRQRLKSISLTAKLWHRQRCSEVLLMVDSGNLVREHTTGSRVIFVKSASIEKSIGDANTLFERERCFVIPIDTTSGQGTVLGFVPDKIEFSDKKYNEEKFIVVPDIRGGKFGGYDGIAPLI